VALVRRVVTGHDGAGRAVFESDGAPPKTVEMVSEVFSLDGPPREATDGGDGGGPGYALEPPPGGATVRIIRLPSTGDWLPVPGAPDDRPGWHTTDTLDVEVILEGEIVLDLDDGEHRLGVGDVVVQRGTAHRWKVVGDGPCAYLAVMLRPEPGAVAPPALTARLGDGPHRRIVTGVDGDGRSVGALDGPAPVALRTGDVTITDLWQTGGVLTSVDQGGDSPGDYELEPVGGGVSVRAIELARAHDPGDAGWHTTDTIDVDVVLSGAVELWLPDLEPKVVAAGEVIVQRGTHHKWVPVGDEPFRMASVMFGLRH